MSALDLRSRLSVRDGVRVLLLRSSTNNSVLGGFAKPGMVTPVWCTGSGGRALLWDHSVTELESLLAEVNFIGVAARLQRILQQRSQDSWNATEPRVLCWPPKSLNTEYGSWLSLSAKAEAELRRP